MNPPPRDSLRHRAEQYCEKADYVFDYRAGRANESSACYEVLSPGRFGSQLLAERARFHYNRKHQVK
jgi:hypothetical protein